MTNATTGRFARHADWLLGEHDARNRFQASAKPNGIVTMDDAYDAQATFVDRMIGSGRTAAAGYKIGLTSKRMQDMCGIDVPVSGVVLSDRILPSGARLNLGDYVRLILEFEISLVMGTDLPPRDRPYDLEEVAAAVRGAMASLEAVDDRNCDYATLDVQSLVADNAWNAGAVVSAAVPLQGDLRDCRGIVTVNGAELDSGFGREALGGPLFPLHWLANHLRERGEGLRAGDLVMTGSLIPAQFPAAGSTYQFSLDGIGSVEVEIVA